MMLRNRVTPHIYIGLSREAASRLAIALCKEAVETGATIALAQHLAALFAQSEQCHPDKDWHEGARSMSGRTMELLGLPC